MGFTAREYRAIQFVAANRGWTMSLAQRPWVYFNDGGTADDQVRRLRISDILDVYDRGRRDELKARKQNQAVQNNPRVV